MTEASTDPADAERPSIFSRRSRAAEIMDDLALDDERLHEALDDLRRVNRWLGGHFASTRVLGALVRRAGLRSVRILDLATGAGDYPVAFVRWGERHGIGVHVTAVDANPATCAYAASAVARGVGHDAAVDVVTADALATEYEDGSFDFVHSALFAHHLDDGDVVRLLEEMHRLAVHDFLINDLHRHPIAYHVVRMLGRLPGASDMFAHDGPVSVLRGFSRRELQGYGARAGVDVRIRWFPGFRWLVTRRG